MKRIFALLVVLLTTMGAIAQVDNYALRFTADEGIVNLGRITKMTAGNSYTLQFWFCPSEWTKGAALVRSGQFSIKMGNEHALVFNDGTNHITVSSQQIATKKWCQVTLRSKKGATEVTLNNKSSYELTEYLTLPAKENSLWLGGGYKGRIDEVRLWSKWLGTEYESFYRNTLNSYNPNWSQVLGYWKMDQEQCPNLVDYKNSYNGTLSATGVAKEKVTDNDVMKYRINLAYGNVERFFDRQIDAAHYSLSNHISILGIWTYDDGSAKLYSDNEAGSLTDGATYEATFSGRSGVLSLPTSASCMTLPAAALPSSEAAYTFESWVYVDTWTEGAYIMRKESADNKGLSLRLGAEGEIIARCNGTDVKVASNKSTGKWFHVGFNSSQFTSPEMQDVSTTKVTLGEGLVGKLDECQFWTSSRSVSAGGSIPMPGADVAMGAWDWYKMAACYTFDKEEDPGFDCYSVQGYIDKMRSYTEGMRGVKFIVTAVQPNDLAGTMANATKRQKMGKALAAIANDPYIDGVDIDFEWLYNESGWTNIAQMCQVAKQNMKSGKILSVSPHKVTYNFPTSYMKYIDYFNFQIYGPQTSNYTQDGYTSAATSFVNWGYPKEKIILSYATTTSKGSNGTAIQGYRWFWNESFPNDATEYVNDAGESFALTGFDQTVWRSQYVVNQDLGGIFYWDLGNDVNADKKGSLARAASYIINSNVEKLVTEVKSAACLPADDEYAPVATPDPEDQGGEIIETEVITSKFKLSNAMAYTLENVNGYGVLLANEGTDNLWLGESSTETFAAPVDRDDPAALWLILKFNNKYYLYNVGRHQFVTIPVFDNTSQPCTFTDDPVEIEVTQKNGNFAFRQDTSAEKGYLCASPQLAAKPVCQWTVDDPGCRWTVITAPGYNVTKAAAEALAKIDPIGITSVSAEEGTQPIYNLQGQRVTHLRPGVFIQNGRKVIVK